MSGGAVDLNNGVSKVLPNHTSLFGMMEKVFLVNAGTVTLRNTLRNKFIFFNLKFSSF